MYHTVELTAPPSFSPLTFDYRLTTNRNGVSFVSHKIQPRSQTPSSEAAWDQGTTVQTYSEAAWGLLGIPPQTQLSQQQPPSSQTPNSFPSCVTILLANGMHSKSTREYNHSLCEYNHSYVNTTTATEGTPLAEGLPEKANAIGD